MSDLRERLKHLGLRAAAEQFDDLCARATRERSSPVELLEYIVDLEEKERAKNSLERRMSRSHVGHLKSMADFDWDWPKKIDRDQVESALRLEFMEQSKNVVLVASHGACSNFVHVALPERNGGEGSTQAEQLHAENLRTTSCRPLVFHRARVISRSPLLGYCRAPMDSLSMRGERR